MNFRREHGHGRQKRRPSRAICGDDDERGDEQHVRHLQRFQGQRGHDLDLDCGARSPVDDDNGRGDGGGGGGDAVRENKEHDYLEVRLSI